MANPSLSVIIPSYNRASFLPTTVKSVLDHAPVGVEVIVVDDGSTDETAEVVRSFGNSIRYLRQDNAGPAAARNTGFSVSQGRHVAFLDSDDSWISDAPSRMTNVLDRHRELDLVFGDAVMDGPGGYGRRVIPTFGGEEFFGIPGVEIEPGILRLERESFFRRLARRNVVFLGSLIVRREAVERVGGFEPGLVGGADWDFALRLAIRHECAWIDQTVAVYLQHAGAMSTDREGMEREFTGALRHVWSEPDLKPLDRRWIRDQLARQEFGNAYRAYERGDLATARCHFARRFRTRPDLTSLGYWMASCLPSSLLRATRDLKRGVLG